MEDLYKYSFVEVINKLTDIIHADNLKWWIDINTGQLLQRNVGELLMLTVSEIAEAMEGHRKDLMDDKLPHRKMVEVELADAMIRIMDLAGGLNMDIGGAIVEKLVYNRTRIDHTHAHRKSEHGKKY